MPLRKYNTATILIPTNTSAPTLHTATTITQPLLLSKSGSPSPPEPARTNMSPKTSLNGSHLTSSFSIANQISTLSDLLPNAMESAASSASASSGSASATITNPSSILPNEIKTRLHKIFNQIEKEFDLLYAENVRLQQQLLMNNVKLDQTESKLNSSSPTNSSSTSTLVASQNLISSTNSSPRSPVNTMRLAPSQEPAPNLSHTQSAAQNLQAIQPVSAFTTAVNALASSTSSSAKSALISSKNRINNLSFPKFRPNAKEFIMQSIKNTSQIVNKTQNTFTSKLQCSLTGHKDGIWDMSCVPIPNHLINSPTLFSQNQNLLAGTASADSTARLWYLNSQPNHQIVSQFNQFSPQQQQQQQQSNHHQSLLTTGFCIQQYCGHSGSVNSIRFHPRFFTDATNLILTASGDSQAHIWQCVLPATNDTLESASESAPNYTNCYLHALSSYSARVGNAQLTSPAHNSSLMANSHYYDLISNTPVIRSPIKRFEGHSDVCIAAEWFPDGELLATASWDRSANVYNVETGKILCNLQHDDYLTNVSIHRIQKIILTSSKDTTFKVWDFRDPICSVNVYQGHSRSVNSAIFVNDDKIATSSDDQTVKLWDLRVMRSPVCTINLNSGINRICTLTVNSQEATNANQPSETLLCLPLDNRDIKIYNLNGERLTRLPRNNRAGHSRLVTSLTSHNNLLLSASFDKQINCWSLDYNPPKSSSNKFNPHSNNKENNLHEQVTTNQTPTSDQNNHKRHESRLFSSSSSSPPPANHAPFNPPPHSASSLFTSPATSNSQHIPPLALITNSTSNKGINTLTKLAERIKI